MKKKKKKKLNGNPALTSVDRYFRWEVTHRHVFTLDTSPYSQHAIPWFLFPGVRILYNMLKWWWSSWWPLENQIEHVEDVYLC